MDNIYLVKCKSINKVLDSLYADLNEAGQFLDGMNVSPESIDWTCICTWFSGTEIRDQMLRVDCINTGVFFMLLC